MNKKKIMISLSVVFSLAVLLAVFLVTPVQVKAETVDFTDVNPTSFVSATDSSLYNFSDQIISVNKFWESNQIFHRTTFSSGLCVSNLGCRISGGLIDTFTLTFPYIWNKDLTFYKPVDYYPYNIWNEEWTTGYYNSSGFVSNPNYFASYSVAVEPNTSYFFMGPVNFDIWGSSDTSYSDMTLLLNGGHDVNFTTSSTTNYIFFSTSNSYSSIFYDNNIALYLSSKRVHYYLPHYSFSDVPLEKTTYHIPNYTDFSSTGSQLEFDLYCNLSTTELAFSSSICSENLIGHYTLTNSSPLYDEYGVINLDFSGLPIYQNYTYYVYFYIWPSNDFTKQYFYYFTDNTGILHDLWTQNYYINDYWYGAYTGGYLSSGFTPKIYANLGFDKTDEYNTGYTNGYNVGYSQGSSAGSDSGYNSGYAIGYSKGFQDGETMNVGDPTVTGLIYSIFQAPVTVLMNLFSFTIFGTQVWYILVTLLVLGLVLWLLRKLLLR